MNNSELLQKNTEQTEDIHNLIQVIHKNNLRNEIIGWVMLGLTIINIGLAWFEIIHKG